MTSRVRKTTTPITIRDGSKTAKSSTRYTRSHIKPNAKSIYNDTRVSKLNGSFYNVISSPSLHIGTY